MRITVFSRVLLVRLIVSISDDQCIPILTVMPPAQSLANQGGATPDGPPAALADRLGFLLKHAQLDYQSFQRPALAPLELDGRLLAVLTIVAAEGPALQQRLSERLGVDRTTMVALIDALEQRGLVERRRDPVDRRGYQVRVTTAGGKTRQRAHQAILEVEHKFLSRLSDEEQRQFRTLLGKLVLDAYPGR
jgi:DNA-binding MarR family transcriptional regulator